MVGEGYKAGRRCVRVSRIGTVSVEGCVGKLMMDVSKAAVGLADGTGTDLFRIALEQAPFAALLFRSDDDLTLIWRNDAHARMTATPDLRIEGRGMFEAFPPSDDEGGDAAMRAIRDAVDEMLDTGAPVEIGPYRYDLQAADGTFVEHHWLIRMSPVSEGGRVTAILQVAQDVTRSVLDRELAETLKRAAVSTASMSYFKFDPATGHFERTSGVDEMFGFEPGEAGETAEPFFAKVHPEDLPGVHAEVERVFAAPRGDVAAFDYRVPQADGTTRYLRIRAEVATDPDDRREKLVGSFMDLTDVETDRQALKQAVAMREALIKEANHRIKNSLAIALSMLRMERRGLKASETEDAERAAAALSALEGRISAISSAHGLMQMDAHGIDVSIHRLMQEMVRQMRATADLDKSDLRLEIAGPDAMLDSDTATPLSLILNEILTNALKYGLDAEGRADVTVTLEVTPDDARIAVRNRIERKNPIDSITSTRLGSMLVKQLADDKGMTVHADAGEAHYTTQVTLPLHKAG